MIFLSIFLFRRFSSLFSKTKRNTWFISQNIKLIILNFRFLILLPYKHLLNQLMKFKQRFFQTLKMKFKKHIVLGLSISIRFPPYILLALCELEKFFIIFIHIFDILDFLIETLIACLSSLKFLISMIAKSMISNLLNSSCFGCR